MLCTLTSLTTVDGVTSILGNCNGHQKQFIVDGNCKVFLNGNLVKLSDLRGNDALEIDGQPAVCIKAARPTVKR